MLDFLLQYLLFKNIRSQISLGPQKNLRMLFNAPLRPFSVLYKPNLALCKKNKAKKFWKKKLRKAFSSIHRFVVKMKNVFP